MPLTPQTILDVAAVLVLLFVAGEKLVSMIVQTRAGTLPTMQQTENALDALRKEMLGAQEQQIAALKGEVTALSTRIAQCEQVHAADMAAKDALIHTLQEEKAALRIEVASVRDERQLAYARVAQMEVRNEELRKDVERLSRRVVRRSDALPSSGVEQRAGAAPGEEGAEA